MMGDGRLDNALCGYFNALSHFTTQLTTLDITKGRRFQSNVKTIGLLIVKEERFDVLSLTTVQDLV